MKYKKIAATILSVLMMAGCYNVFAAEEKNTTVIEADCKLPVIQVTVPSTGQIYINPLKLPVKINGEDADDQIVSTPSAIQNKSEVPLRVDISVKGIINSGSDMTLVSESLKDVETRLKKAFIYFEMKAADTDDSDLVKWDQEYDEEKHISIRTTAKTRKNFITLGADGKKGCYGAFRLTGDCVATPKSEWTETDGISVEIAFTFIPLSADTVI